MGSIHETSHRWAGETWFFNGKEKTPEESDPLFRKWRSENSLITTWLLNSMEESIRKPYLFMYAKEMEDVVCETYSNLENYLQTFELKTQLWNSKQGETDINTYYNNMLTLWQELDLCYNDEWENPMIWQGLKNEKKLNEFLCLAGVNAGFDDVKGRVLGKRPLPSIQEVFSELRQEEGWKRVMSCLSSQPADVEGSALATCGVDPTSNKKKKKTLV